MNKGKKKINLEGPLSSVFAIIIGLLVGFIVLLICNPQDRHFQASLRF